ncbi:conserved hypothetical protein [Neospora caninum Liverpool]|uniref:Uncharacterized protein n=1 Tax=Neospora caninum (strain Liverpool) TaxID=572307 RepID=F0V9T4_NEOCL|nr:conserved hypothetical protein [Neospora caninum Liverpool]CBZ50245.1 conserved hypothetical protein [Neospora caninum Liverpool]CEL64846.1 TPA: hypothetical protein BN1204_007190 [Neospora caninum Liverpool]|eukprot:XP_003880280.1 conserved hypothetical protein [Neospora caninum Liverpool]
MRDEAEAPGEDILLLRAGDAAATNSAGRRRACSSGEATSGEKKTLRTPLLQALEPLRQLPDFLDPSLFAARIFCRNPPRDTGEDGDSDENGDSGENGDRGDTSRRGSLSGRIAKRRKVSRPGASAPQRAEAEADASKGWCEGESRRGKRERGEEGEEKEERDGEEGGEEQEEGEGKEEREQKGEQEGEDDDGGRLCGVAGARKVSVSVRSKAIEALHALLSAETASLLCSFCASAAASSSSSPAFSSLEQRDREEREGDEGERVEGEREGEREEVEKRDSRRGVSSERFEGDFLDEEQWRLVLESETGEGKALGAAERHCEHECRQQLLRGLLRTEAIPVVLRRHRSTSLAASGDAWRGSRGKSRGEKLGPKRNSSQRSHEVDPEDEATSYFLCSVEPLESAVPASLPPHPPAHSSSSFGSRQVIPPRCGGEERRFCSRGQAQPWRDCFLNAGSSVWTLAVSEELPGSWKPQRREGAPEERGQGGEQERDQERDQEGEQGGEQERDQEGEQGGEQEREQGGEQEGEQERDQEGEQGGEQEGEQEGEQGGGQEREQGGEQEEGEGFVVLAVGVHGRQALLSCLKGLRVDEGGTERQLSSKDVSACGKVNRDSPARCVERDTLGSPEGQSAGFVPPGHGFLTDRGLSESVRRHTAEQKANCMQAHPEERSCSEVDKNLGLIQLWRISSAPGRRPRFVMGILHSGGSCRSLEWISASSLDRRPTVSAARVASSLADESEAKRAQAGAARQDPKRGQGGGERKEKERETRVFCGRNPRRQNALFASRAGLLAATFADDSLRIWSVPLAPFLEDSEEEEGEEEREEVEEGEGEEEPSSESDDIDQMRPQRDGRKPRRFPLRGTRDRCSGCLETPFSRGAARCIFLPPVWTFRHAASPRPLSSPFFCVAAAPPPLPSDVSSPSLSGPSFGLPYDAAPLQLAVGSDGGRLFLFSFFPSEDALLPGGSSSTSSIVSAPSSSSSSSPHSSSSSSSFSSPSSSTASFSSRVCPSSRRRGRSHVSLSRHVAPRCVWSAVSAAGASAHLRCCAFLPSADSSLLAVSAASGGDDSSSNNSVLFLDLRFVAPGVALGGAEAAPALLPPIEGKSGCVSSREIFDVAWGPLGRYATAAATNAVIINLRRPQVTQLALKQVLSLVPASCRASARAPRNSQAGAKASGVAGGRQAPKNPKESSPREIAQTAQETGDRCCWSTSMCGHLGLFVFDDGSFVSGSLSLLEQRVFESAELVRWTFPGLHERRLVSVHRSWPSRQLDALPSPVSSPVSRDVSQPESSPTRDEREVLSPCGGHWQADESGPRSSSGFCALLPAQTEGPHDADAPSPLAEPFDGTSLRSLHRQVAARFAQQQDRQMRQLARHGVFVQVFGADEQEETPRIQQAPCNGKGIRQEEKAEAQRSREAEMNRGPSGRGRMQALVEGRKKTWDGEEGQSLWRPDDERVLSLHRIVSVCPFRNRAYFGRRPLAIYGGAAGLLHLRVLH